MAKQPTQKTSANSRKKTVEALEKHTQKPKNTSTTLTAKHPAAYDESKIKTLGSLEHIRLRSGMYIGRLGDGTSQDDGIYILLKEIIDNSVDEFIMKHGSVVNIQYHQQKKMFSVRDFGRGIPLGKVIECVSVINTGAKYNSEVFQFSVGLNGVGTKAVNALSHHFLVRSFRDKKYKEALFSKGIQLEEKSGTTKETNGTYVEFIPDSIIFTEYDYNFDIVKKRLWNYAYLNTGLKIRLNDEIFVSENGLADLLTSEVGDSGLYPILRIEKNRFEFAFTHTLSDNIAHFSFVNGQYTADGGTHLSAFFEGFLRGINEFYGKTYSAADLREGLIAAVSIKIQDPIFESQTKNKLGNTEIKSGIVQNTRTSIVDLLYKNTEIAATLSKKLEQNRTLRQELLAVKREAKEAAKKVSLKVPNFRDCKYHRDHKERGSDTTVFLTEGHSATGSIIPARDVYTQAIFSLRGKLANVVDGKRAKIYKDSELYNMMIALGIENNVEDLRFERVVIATDADFDGFHIRNLIITFFLTYFETLVLENHLYILETPLFRVRDKNGQVYCYSVRERDAAITSMRSPEVTRFKGLGEISPHEFGQFIGQDIKLVPITIKTLKTIPSTLQFYMGKNTEERKQFMKENLL